MADEAARDGAGDTNRAAPRRALPCRGVRVRNVPANIEDRGGRPVNNDSMFVIETVGLCIVHISHLHHVLSKDRLRDLGRVDIAFPGSTACGP